MSIYPANYRETYFEYPALTKIIGCPTYDTLPLLKNEINGNALSVANLGLVISPDAYARVANVTYIMPLHPGE